MAAKNNLKSGNVKELKLGKSFSKGYKDESYHTIRYDFKPASVDSQKVGTLDVVDKEVTLTVPTEGTHAAVFKGNKTPGSKDCLLIINHETGEIVLERISQHVRVKKTRLEGSSKKIMSRAVKTSPTQNIPHTAPVNRSPIHKHNSVTKPTQFAAVPVPSNSMPILDFNTEQKVNSIMSDTSSDSCSGSSSSSDSDSDSEPDTLPPSSSNNLGSALKEKSPTSILSDLELSEED